MSDVRSGEVLKHRSNELVAAFFSGLFIEENSRFIVFGDFVTHFFKSGYNDSFESPEKDWEKNLENPCFLCYFI